MDLLKVGKFIQTKRKEHNLTQLDLANKLNVTDRAISKWECGRSLPDSSIMLDLCSLLEISVNELLSGEELEMKDYNRQAELNIVEITRQKEESDKRLLKAEIVIGITGVVFLCLCVGLGAYFGKTGITWLAITLIIAGFVSCLALCFIALRIEQKAGYYECQVCHNKYVPTYKSALFAMHSGRTRYMKCPKCGKKSWNKKVISNE